MRSPTRRPWTRSTHEKQGESLLACLLAFRLLSANPAVVHLLVVPCRPAAWLAVLLAAAVYCGG